jgi:Ca-activated chloride channel family protein
MKISRRLLNLGLCLILLLVPFRAAGAQGPGAQIRIPHVTLYISVTDTNGEPFGVDPGQIRISENGVVMNPNKLSGSGEIGLLTTLLVMDVSGSMNNAGKLSAAKAAAQAYVDQLRPGDQAGLLTFNTQVTLVQPITNDRAVLSQAIKSLKAENDTAMFDALIEANQILQDYSGRKAIIVLTDGLDNQSKQNADKVVRTIGTSGLSISTIGLGNPDHAGPFFGLDESVLKSLAEEAGGVYSYANNPAELSKLYELYGRALQSEYRITYTSPSKLRDGLNRTLKVSLSGTAFARTKINPGGLLPEVAKPASWTIFAVLLAILTILVFIPGVIDRFLVRKPAGTESGFSLKSKSRIKLK